MNDSRAAVMQREEDLSPDDYQPAAGAASQGGGIERLLTVPLLLGFSPLLIHQLDWAGFTAQPLRYMLCDALAAFGAGFEDVVKVTMFQRDADNFRKMNEAYSSVFTRDHPATTTVVTSLVSPKMLVEIECTAYKP